MTHIDKIHEKLIEKKIIDMGENLVIENSYVVHETVPCMVASIAIRTAGNRDIVTTIRHVISPGEIIAGHEGIFEIHIPEFCIRPGEYELYFYLGNHLDKHYDVVDGILPPLVVQAHGHVDDLEFHESQTTGYFSIKSELIFQQNV